MLNVAWKLNRNLNLVLETISQFSRMIADEIEMEAISNVRAWEDTWDLLIELFKFHLLTRQTANNFKTRAQSFNLNRKSNKKSLKEKSCQRIFN